MGDTLQMSSKEQKISKGPKEKASICQQNSIIESIECSKNGSWLYISQRKTAGKELCTVYKDKDLVKHCRNLPGFLQRDGKSSHTRNKTFDIGVLDWSRLENWKSDRKRAMKTSINHGIPQLGQPASDSSQLGSFTRRRLPKGARPKGKAMEVGISETVGGQTLDLMQTFCSEGDSSENKGKQAGKMLKSIKETSLDDSRKYGSQNLQDLIKRLPEVNMDHDDDDSFNEYKDVLFSLQENKSGLVTFRSSPDLLSYFLKKANGANIIRSIPVRWLVEPILKHKGQHITEKVQKSTDLLIEKPYGVHAILQLKMKNEIPFFKLVVDNSSNILAAVVKKLPSGKDDSSLIYSFYSVHEIKNKNSKDWKKRLNLTEKGHGFEYKILGHMKISSSYHAEFSGLERDLFVVRESVLYGPHCMGPVEMAATIVKNTFKESYGGIGASKSTVVILPGCNNHSLPNNGQPSSLVNRWRSGGVCDCGGWDIGCELGVLSKKNETYEVASGSASECLELCYQGQNNVRDFSLVQLEDDGLYSLEHNASISLLQAFSICVAVVTSQKLTHIFQVNHLQDENNFTKPTMTKHQKVKSQTTVVHAKKPPV